MVCLMAAEEFIFKVASESLVRAMAKFSKVSLTFGGRDIGTVRKQPIFMMLFLLPRFFNCSGAMFTL